MFDGEAFGKQMVEIVRGHVDRVTAPLLERIDALEKRELLLPEKGDPGEPGQPGAPGPAGEVDMEAVKALVDAAVAALPPAERGEKGEAGKDGLPGENGADGAPGEPGRDGKDGLGLADALIGREGDLILTLTDGTTKSLGRVVGQDGSDGKDGDVFTIDDFDIVPLKDERSFKFCFTRGEVMHSFEFAFPVVLDRGVFKEGQAYEKGDAVSWAGSLWIAQRSTDAKPDGPDSGWRLAVKRGRDGKDAR